MKRESKWGSCCLDAENDDFSSVKYSRIDGQVTMPRFWLSLHSSPIIWSCWECWRRRCHLSRNLWASRTPYGILSFSQFCSFIHLNRIAIPSTWTHDQCEVVCVVLSESSAPASLCYVVIAVEIRILWRYISHCWICSTCLREICSQQSRGGQLVFRRTTSEIPISHTN